MALGFYFAKSCQNLARKFNQLLISTNTFKKDCWALAVKRKKGCHNPDKTPHFRWVNQTQNDKTKHKINQPTNQSIKTKQKQQKGNKNKQNKQVSKTKFNINNNKIWLPGGSNASVLLVSLNGFFFFFFGIFLCCYCRAFFFVSSFLCQLIGWWLSFKACTIRLSSMTVQSSV